MKCRGRIPYGKDWVIIVPITPFDRLVSNSTIISVGIDRDAAAMNAANATGGPTNDITRLSLKWPSVRKYDNDKLAFGSPSPFASISNPEYVWSTPISNGQFTSYAVASKIVTTSPEDPRISMNVNLVAFADNAMTAQISLFEETGLMYTKVAVQPTGLDNFILIAGTPNDPTTGLTEGLPYNWQDVRVYSTFFQVPVTPAVTRNFKIVISFGATNYLPSNLIEENPAGLQFMADIYAGRV